MSCLEYKGYLGSAEVSVEDGVVFGKLLYIRDLVTYEASTPVSLFSAFKEAVDDYIEDCLSEAREPDKPLKGSFNVRVSPDLHRSLVIAAREHETTLNDYVGSILTTHEKIKRSQAPKNLNWYKFVNARHVQQWPVIIQTYRDTRENQMFVGVSKRTPIKKLFSEAGSEQNTKRDVSFYLQTHIVPSDVQ